MSVRTAIILLNVAAVTLLLVFLAVRVLRLRGQTEEPAPQNLEKFYDDETLEGPHLERVLALALTMLIIGVITMVVYFLYEPFRGEKMADAFEERSVERGAVLFANAQSEAYSSTVSLLCANCHGVDGGGGVAPVILQSEDPACVAGEAITDELARAKPQCLPKQGSWAAPNLQLAPLRYSRAQLTEIITYGRPGTPMPAWGVKSGRGALNEQSIQDLVNYIESIKTTPQKAQAEAAAALAQVRTDAREAVEGRTVNGQHQPGKRELLQEARAELAALPATATAAQRLEAQRAVDTAQQELDAAVAWNTQMQSASDGQILFQNNCARCHTKGWSTWDPANPLSAPMPGPMGGGAYGPNLRSGQVNRQFPPPDGDAKLESWITEGAERDAGYGARGIASGRMPHFGAVLTKAQIEAIMAYIRTL